MIGFFWFFLAGGLWVAVLCSLIVVVLVCSRGLILWVFLDVVVLVGDFFFWVVCGWFGVFFVWLCVVEFFCVVLRVVLQVGFFGGGGGGVWGCGSCWGGFWNLCFVLW